MEKNISGNHSILQLFPGPYRKFWLRTAQEQAHIQEIRLRTGRPVILCRDGQEVFLTQEGEFLTQQKAFLTERGEFLPGQGEFLPGKSEFLPGQEALPAGPGETAGAYCPDGRELEELLDHICHSSPYAYEEELRRGFVTAAGGHRVGVAGQAVLEPDGRVRTIKNISYVNIRISHQRKGAGDGVLPRMYRGGVPKSALIISPPGCGKTTLLRDLIRQISNGSAYGPGVTVGVVDERSELAGTFLGRAQNDMGMRTDVLDGCPKAEGCLMLLRSMSPRVIAIDELGSGGELEALGQAAAGGCRILATAHGEDRRDVERRFGWERTAWERLFDLFIILGKEDGKCVVRRVEERGEGGA